jgi:arginine decarboxylase-like protein
MEKLDYFLFLKKKYKDILNNLKEIDKTYFDIIVSDKTKGRYLEHEITSKNKCKKQINDVEYYIQRIEKEINNLCEHNYIEDDIDITPDISQKIKYCSICEHTCKL